MSDTESRKYKLSINYTNDFVEFYPSITASEGFNEIEKAMATGRYEYCIVRQLEPDEYITTEEFIMRGLQERDIIDNESEATGERALADYVCQQMKESLQELREQRDYGGWWKSSVTRDLLKSRLMLAAQAEKWIHVINLAAMMMAKKEVLK